MDHATAITPVILCGGVGTRLWPLSRHRQPKQFLRLVGERSLFQDTVLRAKALSPSTEPIVVGSAAHRFIMAAELGQLAASAQLLLEPTGRNTAPALAMAALHVSRGDPQAVLAVMPADHYVRDTAHFVRSVRQAAGAAERGSIVTFGVTPTEAHTGYGYIRKGAPSTTPGVHAIAEFVEKPDAETAEKLVSSGEYLWNCGVFLLRADVYLCELEMHAPDIAEAAHRAFRRGRKTGTDWYLPVKEFTSCPSRSIDYAVMEHTQVGAVAELNTGWTDVGSWSSVWAMGAQGAAGNATHGDVLLTDVSHSIVHAGSRLVAAIGLKDQIVIETPDAVLVAPLDRTQEVSQLVKMLERDGRSETDRYPRSHHAWGWYECVSRETDLQIWRVYSNPGVDMLLSWGNGTNDRWFMVRGVADVVVEVPPAGLEEGNIARVPATIGYRVHNVGSGAVEMLWVRHGRSLGGIDDVVVQGGAASRGIGLNPIA